MATKPGTFDQGCDDPDARFINPGPKLRKNSNECHERHTHCISRLDDHVPHRLLEDSGPLRDGTLLCFVKSFFEDSEGLAGDVAFEAAADFSCGFAFGGSAFDVGFGGWIMALPT